MDDCTGTELLDCFGREFGKGTGEDCRVLRKRIDPPEIAAGADQEGHLDILAREAADQVRAEEAGGPCDQYLHRGYSGRSEPVCKRKICSAARAELVFYLIVGSLTLRR